MTGQSDDASGRVGIIAAGGTGGHLFPAQALAQELGRRQWRVVLMSDERVNQYGAAFPCEEIIEIPSATLSPRAPVKAVVGVMKILAGVAKSYYKIGRLKPDFVIGFGGYPTMPPLLAARLRRVPTIMHEQNAVMGRVNRLLAKSVGAIASTFDNPRLLPPEAASKVAVTGNPVRDAVIDCAGQPYEAPEIGGAVNLVVFGGSQGARVFSDIVPAAVGALDELLKKRLRVTQQCRREDLERVRFRYETHGVEAELSTFFGDMPSRIAAAHLVICRSGASTLSELGVIGRPAIMVPLPHSLDNDQLYNAKAFAEAGGGWICEQDEFQPETFGPMLQNLLDDPDQLAAAADKARGFGTPDAVKRLADLVVAQGEGPVATDPATEDSGRKKEEDDNNDAAEDGEDLK